MKEEGNNHDTKQRSTFKVPTATTSDQTLPAVNHQRRTPGGRPPSRSRVVAVKVVVDLDQIHHKEATIKMKRKITEVGNLGRHHDLEIAVVKSDVDDLDPIHHNVAAATKMIKRQMIREKEEIDHSRVMKLPNCSHSVQKVNQDVEDDLKKGIIVVSVLLVQEILLVV